MRKSSAAAKIALVLICSNPLVAQKKAPPATIRFQGAPQYSQKDLLTAAGLDANSRLTPAQLKAHAKQLSDTGFFKEVKFSPAGKTLLFTLTPVSQLFPMHLENVPVTPGKELEAKLQERFPLYRGLLPAGGSVVDGICKTFEEMLASKNVKTTVKAALTSGLGPQKITAVNFAVVSPTVHMGHIQLSGVSQVMQAKASGAASGQTGNNFDTENSAKGLQRVFEDLYQEQGYAAVQVQVSQGDPVASSDQAVDIPYTVTINEGGVYKLGKIDFPADALVTRAEVEKKLPKTPAGSERPLNLYLVSVCEVYHARGYLDCSVVPHPAFNEATHIVNYSLEINPGPQYYFASVKFDGAPEAMAAKLKAAWKMAPGDVFDESYLPNFTALAQKKDKALTKWLQSVIATYDVKADPEKHEVNCIFHFSKAAQNPR